MNAGIETFLKRDYEIDENNEKDEKIYDFSFISSFSSVS